MIENFVFHSAVPRIVFGRGSIARLEAELGRHAISRPFVLCTGSGLELWGRIAASLPDGFPPCDVIRIASSAITEEDFERIRTHAQGSGSDGFIGLGGGTAIGMAKAVAANCALSYVAVVTTYSGSEMASNWGYGAGKGGRRGGGPGALPSTAIYDPELTLGLPAVLSGQSGMNAMAHAAESLYGADRNPVVETMAESALCALARSLPAVVARPADMEARTGALYGAWLAAAFRAQVGVEHAIAQKVRQRYGLSHAGTHAAVLPYAIAFNRAAAPEAMRRIEAALGAEDAGRGLYELNLRMGLPTGLKDLGMKADDIDEAADIVGTDFPNPRPVTRSDIVELITQAFHGQAPRF